MRITENGKTYEVNDWVSDSKEFIGERVKVVKGRKYPIGAEYVIKKFMYYHPQGRSYISVTYAQMESGERILVDNLRLVKPRKTYIPPEEKWTNDDKCPKCGKRGYFVGESFDPGWDYYFEHYVCDKCKTRFKTVR